MGGPAAPCRRTAGQRTGPRRLRARLQAAKLLDALDQTDRAVELLDEIVAQGPTRPHSVVSSAEALRASLRQRLARRPYRVALEGWRALQRGDLDAADGAFARSLALDPSAKPSPVVRANALFDSAHLIERRGDRTRAKALYLEASHVFGADRIVTERAAHLASTIEERLRR